jgi:hypothetical protein
MKPVKQVGPIQLVVVVERSRLTACVGVLAMLDVLAALA